MGKDRKHQRKEHDEGTELKDRKKDKDKSGDKGGKPGDSNELDNNLNKNDQGVDVDNKGNTSGDDGANNGDDDNDVIWDADKGARVRNEGNDIYSNVGLAGFDQNGNPVPRIGDDGHAAVLGYDNHDKPIYGFDANTGEPVYDRVDAEKMLDANYGDIPPEKKSNDNDTYDKAPPPERVRGDTIKAAKGVKKALGESPHANSSRGTKNGNEAVCRCCGLGWSKGGIAAVSVILLLVVAASVTGGVLGTQGNKKSYKGKAQRRYVPKNGSRKISLGVEPGLDAGETATFEIKVKPAKGNLSGNGSDLTYTPNVDFIGEDSFSYSVTINGEESEAVKVSLTVFSAKADKQIVDDSKPHEVVLGVEPALPDGVDATYKITQQPSQGKLTGNAPELTYTPSSGASGNDSFAFTVTVEGVTSPAEDVTLTLSKNAEQSYSAKAMSLYLPHSHTIQSSITLGVNESTSPTSTSFTIKTQPTQGTLSGTAPKITYTPNADADENDSFTYTVTVDGKESAAATVDLILFRALGKDRFGPMAGDLPITFDVEPTLPDGVSVTYAITTKPSLGSLSGSGAQMTYTAKFGPMNNCDELSYTATVGGRTSSPAEVNIIGVPTFDWSTLDDTAKTNLVNDYKKCLNDLANRSKHDFWAILISEVKKGKDPVNDQNGSTVNRMPIDVQLLVVQVLRDLRRKRNLPQEGEAGYLSRADGQKYIENNNSAKLKYPLPTGSALPDTVPLFEAAKDMKDPNGNEVPRFYKLRALAGVLLNYEAATNTSNN